MTTTDPPKKNRLSRILGGSKREKSPDQPPSFPPDSAYASSDTTTPAAGTYSNEQIVPAEKNSDIGNIDTSRNLGVRPSTGEVLDRDTGEVVTVVTTTTTTTTTTTRKPGKKDPEVRKDVQETTQTQPVMRANGTIDSTVEPSGIIAEMPATPAGTSDAPPPLPAPVNTSAQDYVPDHGSSNKLRKHSPGIPPKSANRRSGEYNVSPEGSYFARPGPTGNTPPLSPTRPNFSYPSRGRDSLDGSSLATTSQPQNHNKSTMADLRAAAKGIHGVGETLRGTLNAAVDQNFARKDPKKAAKANAKNEAVLARGREEVAGIPLRDRFGHNTTASPQPPHTYTSSAHPPPVPQNQPPTHVGGRTPFTAAAAPQPPQQRPSNHQAHNALPQQIKSSPAAGVATITTTTLRTTPVPQGRQTKKTENVNAKRVEASVNCSSGNLWQPRKENCGIGNTISAQKATCTSIPGCSYGLVSSGDTHNPRNQPMSIGPPTYLRYNSV